MFPPPRSPVSSACSWGIEYVPPSSPSSPPYYPPSSSPPSTPRTPSTPFHLLTPPHSPPPLFRTIAIVIVPEDPFGLVPDPMDYDTLPDSRGGTQHWWDPDEDYVVNADHLPTCSCYYCLMGLYNRLRRARSPELMYSPVQPSPSPYRPFPFPVQSPLSLSLPQLNPFLLPSPPLPVQPFIPPPLPVQPLPPLPTPVHDEPSLLRRCFSTIYSWYGELISIGV